MNTKSINPKVSVIIPTYNRPQLVKRAIESVLKQTYQNFEIIIIDGSPNNETERVVQQYLNDSRIRYFHEPDVHTNTVKDRTNIAKARNKAIKLARGEYIAPLDDDDFWCDERKLEKQVQFLLQNPEYVLCGGRVIRIVKKNSEEKLFFREVYPENDENIRKMMLFAGGYGNIVHSTIMFRKKDFESVGGYEEKYPLREDWDLHLKLGKIGKLYNFKEYFGCYEIGAHIREHPKYVRECWKDAFRVIMKYRKDYPGFCKALCFYLICYLYTFLPSFLRKPLKRLKNQVFKSIS
jgi:glycosyltransferase domain-containing protein